MNTKSMKSPSWLERVNAENKRCEIARGLKPGAIKYHLHDDPRESVSRQLQVRGLVSISDEGKRKFNGDGGFRLLGRLLRRDERRKRGDRLAKQARFAKRIVDHTEDGKVAIVHGSRDCDGVEVRGLVKILPSTVVHVDRFLDEIHEGAEGPTWWDLEKPSVAEGVESSSRDLVAEATENGHSWVIRP